MFNGKNILEEGNSNFALLDEPEINKVIDEAEVVNDPAERNKAWGEVDKVITETAAGIPWLWDTQPMLRSADVNGVVSRNRLVGLDVHVDQLARSGRRAGAPPARRPRRLGAR